MLKELGIGAGDEVATQAFTCVAVPEGIMAAGAKPVYVDLEDGGVNMDPEDLLSKISQTTKAIIVQHTFGIPAQLDKIAKIAKENNIPIIEDCCHTLSSTFSEKTVGEFGVGAFYSFEWGKPIITGIGGGLIVNNSDLREKINKSYNSNFSFPSPDLKLSIQYIIFNILYRPILYWPLKRAFHFLSKFGLAKGNYNPVNGDSNQSKDFSLKLSEPNKNKLDRKLKLKDKIIDGNKIVAQKYKTLLNQEIKCPIQPSDSVSDLARYPIFTEKKDQILKSAKRANLELADFYNTPIHPLKGDELIKVQYTEGSCPNAEKAARSIVSLPINSRVSDKYISKVTKLLNHSSI